VLSLALIAPALLTASCQKLSPSPPATNHNERAADTPRAGNGPPGVPPPAMNKRYPGTGVVVTINRKEGGIEINHEEIKDLMPAMQMEFRVRDKALLDQAAPGDRVNFTIEETPKGEFLIELKKVAPSP
jgi:Cu/Ag efflux protein CusF